MANKTEHQQLVNQILYVIDSASSQRYATAVRLADWVLADRAKQRKALCDELLKHGHGGGNWRRLVMSAALSQPQTKDSKEDK